MLAAVRPLHAFNKPMLLPLAALRQEVRQMRARADK